MNERGSWLIKGEMNIIEKRELMNGKGERIEFVEI